jgi:MGT family glycosyltransferase
MSKVLYVNANLYGHINPTLPVVKELVERGEEVYYFSTKEFQTKIEAVGAKFVDYGESFEHFLHSFRPYGDHPFYTLMEYMLAMDRIIVSIVLDKTVGMTFDYMLHDIMFGGGTILSKKLKLPAISTCSSFVMEKPPIPLRMLEPGFHPQLDFLYGELRAAKVEWDLEKLQMSDIFCKKEALNLVFTSKRFQPQGDTYDASFQFVGPSLTDRQETLEFTLDTSKIIIYISMGTITNNCINFYNKCLEAFPNDDYQIIMSVGKKIDISSLQQIPNNYLVRNYVPQLEVIKHADIMISHGGLNSVSEALYYGVPVIAIPLSNDQPAVAKQLTEQGAGITLSMSDITPEILHSSVHVLLAQQSFQIRSKEIGASFVEAGGYKKAAELILNYV